MTRLRSMKCSVAVMLVCLALLFCPAVTASQSFFAGGRLGIGLGTVAFEDDEAAGRAGINVGQRFGGLVGYDLSSVFSVQLELAYTSRGWPEGKSGGGRKLSYIQLPLLFVVRAPWKTSPHLLVGPAVSFEVGCKVSGIPEIGSVGCADSRVQWDRNKTLFGVHVGLGIGRPLRNGKVEFQLAGDISLRNTITERLPRGFNRLFVLMASATYKIPIGG